MELITDTFVLVADDCPVTVGTIPPGRGTTTTVAQWQYQILGAQPYSMTLEELMEAVHIARQGLTSAQYKRQREAIHQLLFGKPYPCLRASPLPKKYGWGIHHDAQGCIAIVAMESDAYRKFAASKQLKVVKAMKSKRN